MVHIWLGAGRCLGLLYEIRYMPKAISSIAWMHQSENKVIKVGMATVQIINPYKGFFAFCDNILGLVVLDISVPKGFHQGSEFWYCCIGSKDYYSLAIWQISSYLTKGREVGYWLAIFPDYQNDFGFCSMVGTRTTTFGTQEIHWASSLKACPKPWWLKDCNSPRKEVPPNYSDLVGIKVWVTDQIKNPVQLRC